MTDTALRPPVVFAGELMSAPPFAVRPEVLGAIADYSHLKKRLMALFCYIGAIATCLLFFVTGNLYLLIEAAPRDDGYLARVEEYDPQLRFQSAGWLEFPLREANKGIEGLDCVRRGGVLYLLGLCERQPGGGRVVVFRRGRRNWKQHTTIELPDTVRFTDYSAISVAGDRLAVVSQESSALWLGRLLPSTWQVSGPGRTYLFPRDADGGIAYCTVEGVCWRAADEFVVVSDRAKPGKRDRPCRAEDESLHLFALPAAPG